MATKTTKKKNTKPHTRRQASAPAKRERQPKARPGPAIAKPRPAVAVPEGVLASALTAPFSLHVCRELTEAAEKLGLHSAALDALKARRSDVRKNIAANDAEAAQTIADEAEEGRGKSERYSLEASKRLTGLEEDNKRLARRLIDLDEQIEQTRAYIADCVRTLREVPVDAAKGAYLLDPRGNTQTPDTEAEPNAEVRAEGHAVVGVNGTR